MKNLVVPVAVILIAVNCYLMFISVQKKNKVQTNLDTEMYYRMVAEESLQKSKKKASRLERQLADANEKLEKIEDILSQDKLKHAELRKQLNAVTSAKNELEEKLKKMQQGQPYY